MDQVSRKSLLEVGMWTDIALCSAGLVVGSTVATAPFWRKEVLLVDHPLRQLILLLLLVVGWHASLVFAGMYQSFRLNSSFELAVAVAKAVAWATLCTAAWMELHIAASGRVASLSTLNLAELAVSAVVTALLLLSSRLVTYTVLREFRKRGRNLRYALIVGTNKRALQVADSLTSDRALGYRLVGFVDDLWHAESTPAAYSSMLIGRLDQVPELLRTLALDEVIIALPVASTYSAIRAIVQECRQHGILVRCEASLVDYADARSPSLQSAIQFVKLHHTAWDRWAVTAKRLLDISLAVVALGLTMPLMILIAVAIKTTSPGPVLFKQERLGLGKRRFKIYKFRTMVEDAESLLSKLEHLNQTGGPTFKLRQDPRITKVGSFLRRTSLDELPQFINVLAGDMSMVGPRPLPLRDYNGFSQDWHRRRFSVKPGITCLWQVMGRSSIGFDRWMELDIRYIDTWSIWLDLKILARTIPVVLRGSGSI